MRASSRADIGILRELARRVAEIAARPEHEEKRRAIRALNRLEGVPPPIYCFPEGVWLEILPWERIGCADPLLRGWEMQLRLAIATHEFLRDDQPVDAVFNVPWDAEIGGNGLTVGQTMTDADTRKPYYIHPFSNLVLSSHAELGAIHYEPPLKERGDIGKLRTPEVRVNRERSEQWLTLAHEIFDGILAVRRRHHWWHTVGGVPQTAVMLRGMDTLMVDMLDDPDWVRELVGRLAANHHAVLDQIEAGGYFTLNNGCEWINNGGIGYTDVLPSAGFDPAQVRCRDLWGGMESQDLLGISPAMYEELFFPYLQPIVERFGLGCYGCCEPLHDWIPVLKRIRNLRRISISPWADVARSAERLGSGHIMCIKPHPAAVATGEMDDPAILRNLVEIFTAVRQHDARAEVMLKDLHTVQHQPQRLPRWVELAREARRRVYE
jgi:hypothetical protein